MRRIWNRLAVAGLSLLVTLGAAGQTPPAGGIPPHPNQLEFSPLEYQVPDPGAFRVALPGGVVAYIAEDRILPVFDITVLVRAGRAYEPADKAGLAALVAEQLRDGGTQLRTPEEFDERVEFLAADLGASAGATQVVANLSLLSKDLDEGLGLLFEMLREPRFDEERLRQAKERRLQNIKRRNDSTESIEELEWGFLMNGESHFSNLHPTSASINAIQRDDLLRFHREVYHPANMVLAVAGDFDRDDMIRRLTEYFTYWPAGQAARTEIPAPQHDLVPGVYVVHKDDVNQGRVSIGHKATVRGGPDEFPLLVMNMILGGSGFQSRLMARVRSAEGLAYDVGSEFEQGVYYPGDFRCYFQSKSEACAYATSLVLGEIERLRSEPVSADELHSTLSLMAEFFPQQLPDKLALMRRFAMDEFTGRDPRYWCDYVARLRAVTAEDVLRVAQQYLHPDHLVILAVGQSDALVAGGFEKAPNLKFQKFGRVTKWAVRDPETLRR